MISDRYVLKPYPQNLEKILDISEHMAACYGFEAKELLMIRLITEEMIAAVHKGLSLVPGQIWFSVKDEMFTITVSIGTDVFGMSKEERKKLSKSVNTSRKSGLFGVVQEFMDYLTTADEEASFQGYVGVHYSGHMGVVTPQSADAWEMDSQNWLLPEHQTVSNTDDNALEISLLKGFADDIRVTSKKKTLEMSVMKKIPTEFSFYYISAETK